MKNDFSWKPIIWLGILALIVLVFIPRCGQWTSRGCDIPQSMVLTVTHGSPSSTQYCDDHSAPSENL